MGGLEFFLIALVMYGIWRTWMWLRGEDGSPEGRWRPRTDAMSEYMERTNPGSTRLEGRYGWVRAVVLLTLAIGVIGAAVIIGLSGR